MILPWESRKRKGFDYGILFVLIFLCAFGSISCFYFYEFDFSLNEPFESWVNVATYFNNALNPILLVVTIILLYRTWQTSKSELEETRSLVSTQVLLERSNGLRLSCEKLQSVIKAPLNTYGVLNSAIVTAFEVVIDEVGEHGESVLIKNSSFKQSRVEEILDDSELLNSVCELIKNDPVLECYLKEPEYKAFLKYECSKLEYLKTFEDLISVFIQSKGSETRASCFEVSVVQNLFGALKEDSVDSPFFMREYEPLYYFNLIADELVMLFDLAKGSTKRMLVESAYVRTVKLSFNEKQLDNLCYICNRDDALGLLKIDRQNNFRLICKNNRT